MLYTKDSFISALSHALRIILTRKCQRFGAVIHLQFHGFQQLDVATRDANLTTTYDNYQYWNLQIECKSTAREVMHMH